ncbi:hypothetical protein PoB_002051600 [Plakobranchus ocellatus]|uniref:Secreted protein n=1 Tax=Plakobranchus ocellatus TaxID=259542 RepID=A0AAV3Z3Z0_9GAST|nr:hypothetical protein PoB_002051600 [Plakobranchus ocellatus]
MATLLTFSGWWLPPFFSEINAAAWSPVYCMTRRGNFRITLAAVVMATQFCRQRISPRNLLGHPMAIPSTISRYSDKTCKIVSSCSPHRQHTEVADHVMYQ